MTTTNLLSETERAIADTPNTPEDIIFIGSQTSGHYCTWEQFCVLADVEYDSGYGGQEVARDLIIVFKDGTYLYRSEYDGSEWWDYTVPFRFPRKLHDIARLISGGWSTLDEIHKPEGDDD